MEFNTLDKMLYVGMVLFVIILIFVISYFQRKKKLKTIFPSQGKYQKLILQNEELKLLFQTKTRWWVYLLILFIPLLLFPPIFILFFICWFTVFLKKTNERQQVLKKNCFLLLEKGMNRIFSYEENKGVLESIYRDAQFEFYDDYDSEDYITGNLLNLVYEMGEVLTTKKQKDHDGNRYNITVFHGIFSYINLPKDMEFDIYIQYHHTKNIGRKEILLENENFQNEFDVYSDNEIKTYELLTPDIMEKILELKSSLNFPFEVKVIHQKMYFRFFTGGLFEGTFKKDELANKLAEYEFIILKMEEIMMLFIENIKKV